MQKFAAAVGLVLAWFSFASAQESVPKENIEKPKTESISPFAADALLQSLSKGTPDEALFFPGDAFAQVKAIAKPMDYYKQLMKWYHDDVAREHKRLSGLGALSLDSFKLGSCKWKEKGKEANAIPYLSCYKSVLNAKDSAGKAVKVEVRTLINWGQTWYITHLGPIPQAK